MLSDALIFLKQELAVKRGGVLKLVFALIFSWRGFAVMGTVILAVATSLIVLYEAARFVIGLENTLYQVPAALIVIYAAWKLIDLIPRAFLDCFYAVPTTQLGLRKLFQKRTGEVEKEGLAIKHPFVESFDLIPDVIYALNASVEAPDKTTKKYLRLEFSLRYRIDPDIRRDGKSVCLEVDEAGRKSGQVDSIFQKFRVIARAYDAEDLLNSVPALADVLSCHMRLARMPHDSSIDVAKVIPKYNTEEMRARVKELLKNEHEDKNSNSPTEILLGVDVLEIKILKLDLNEETVKAQKAVAEADERARILNTKIEKIVALRKPVSEGGAGVESSQQAVDAVEVVLDSRIIPTKISVQGNVPVVPLPGNFFGGSRESADRKKTDERGEEKKRKGGNR